MTTGEEDYRAMVQSFDAYFCGKSTMMMCEVFTFGEYFRMDMSKELDLLSNKMNRSEKNTMVLLAQLAYKMTSKPEKGSWIKLSDAILKDEARGQFDAFCFSRYALKTGIHLWSLGKHKDVKQDCRNC
ncbi:MAG: hypothetical protein IPH36_17475 [Saprospiraceae bacterium]|nr:hypothetical protein [Saprospiraceae bacterium]